MICAMWQSARAPAGCVQIKQVYSSYTFEGVGRVVPCFCSMQQCHIVSLEIDNREAGNCTATMPW